MKKIILSLLLLAVIIPATYAQFTKIGVSTGYDYRYYFNDESSSDHKLKNPMLSFSAIYEVNLPFHIVPKFNIYFPNITKFGDDLYNEKNTISGYSIDVDGHYVFNSLDDYEIFGLAGLNILYARNKYVYGGMDIPDTKEVTTNTNLGVNLGMGVYWKVKEEFDLFYEVKALVYKHTASGIKLRGIATVGILLNMEYLWSKETESGY